MTLPASSAITLEQIADEFSLAHNSVFPTAFYGLGGAPASGALSLEDFYGRSAGFSAYASPAAISGYSATNPVYGGPCDIVVSGGSGSFTYSWANVGGDATTALSPSVYSTIFKAPSVPAGTDTFADFDCTITDTVSSAVVVVSVPVALSRT